MPLPSATTTFTQLASTYLDNYQTRLNNAVKRADGVTKVLFAKGAVEEETGGGEFFLERVMYGVNPNVAWRGKNDQIDTLPNEGVTMARVQQRIIDGTIVLNRVDRDRAISSGDWAIGKLVEDAMMMAQNGYVQTWADSLRADSAAANDPFTLLPSSNANSANGILAPIAPASQTATTAGISRLEFSWWRNQYTTTSIDISTEAGRASLHSLAYLPCVFGGASLEDEPDFGLASGTIIADLSAAIDTTRRGGYDDKFLGQLGLRGVVFQNASLIRDAATKLNNKVAFINTRYLKLKFLRPASGNFQRENWNQDNGMGEIPVSVSSFERDRDSLNDIAIFYAVASLVPLGLRNHGLADNVI